MSELGLFPLPIVLVPTERIPLHIFEPRYKELIDECIELGEEFGLALATGDGAVHEIGTRARVAKLVEALDDGSMNIVVEGGERFRLLDLTTGRAFTTGIVEPVQDDDEPALSADAERPLAPRFQKRRGRAGPALTALRLRAARASTSLSRRSRELLPLTSPRARMTALVGLLEVALEAVKLELTLRERAGRNGKVAPLDPDTDTTDPEGAAMSSPFIFIATNRLKPGKLDRERKRVPGLVEFIEANEPRLIAFNEYVNDTGDEVTVVQIHPDAASMEAHMGIVRERAMAYAETLDATVRVQVFGEPTDAILEVLRQQAGSGVEISVNGEHLGGFTRSAAQR